MDQESSNQMEQQQSSSQCRNGCGFYSNAGTDGLCSVCYKDLIKKKNQNPNSNSMASLSLTEANAANAASNAASKDLDTGTTTITVPQQTSASSLLEKREDCDGAVGGAKLSLATPPSTPTSSSACVASGSPGEDDMKDSGKKKKNRCLSCKKKVGLTGFTCRCGGLFCSLHRYSDKHSCPFDYKELGQEEIRKSNPVVVAKKVQKI